MEREVEMGEWEERIIRKVHGVYIQPGLSCMQERTDTPLRLLEALELAQRDSRKRMQGFLPRVEDSLVKFAGTNEIQLGALAKGLLEVGKVVKGLLSREGQPNTTGGTPPYGLGGGARAAKGGGVVAAGH